MGTRLPGNDPLRPSKNRQSVTAAGAAFELAFELAIDRYYWRSSFLFFIFGKS